MADEKLPDDVREKIVAAFDADRVTWSDKGERYFERAGVIKMGADADFSIVEVEVESVWGPYQKDGHGNKGGIRIGWSSASAGFGSMTIYIDNDGKLKCQRETMGPKFLKTVLAKLIDQCELD